MRRCAYQGEEGSYSYQAACNYFAGEEVSFIGKRSFKELFLSLQSDEVECALIPLENTLAGSIHENYDHLRDTRFYIVGEILQQIDHCLLSSGEEIEKITRVLSHQKALEQCLQLIASHTKMRAEIAYDTAGAAKEIAGLQDPTIGAIASRSAAKIYGLNILKENVQDYPDNYTRFALLSKEACGSDGADKCSLMMVVPHIVGALANRLQLVKDHGVNLIKIESRPLQQRPFEYIFYLDLLFDRSNACQMEPLIAKLKEHSLQLRVLGFYKGDSHDRTL